MLLKILKNMNKKGAIAPFLIFSLLSSCGEDPFNKKLKIFRQRSVERSSFEISCGSPTTENTFTKEVDDAFMANGKRIVTGNGTNLLKFEKPELSYKKPLIISETILKNRLANLRTNIDKYTKDSVDLELLELRSQFLRMRANACRVDYLKNQEANDVTTFLNLTNYCKERNLPIDCLTGALKVPKVSTDFKNQIIDLCRRGQSLRECVILYDINARKKKLPEMMYIMRNRFLQKNYLRFFSANPTHIPKLDCQNSGEKIKISIPINYSETITFSKEDFIVAVKKYWDSKTIEFIFTDKSDGIQIAPVDKTVSYVQYNESSSTLYLSNYLSREMFALTSAHEFGHLLGFPDCYLEFLNKNEEIVYYELPSKNNLMCSLNDSSTIPEFYRDQIVNDVCNFRKK